MYRVRRPPRLWGARWVGPVTSYLAVETMHALAVLCAALAWPAAPSDRLHPAPWRFFERAPNQHLEGYTAGLKLSIPYGTI